MLSPPVLQLADEIDLEAVPTCPMCLFDLALAIREGRTPSRGLVSRTTEWVWLESGDAVNKVVVRTRMDERPSAEEALRDMEVNGSDGRFAQAVVWRLASELADEMSSRC